MNAREAKALLVSSAGVSWRCASCGQAATCPMLNDETRNAAFAAAPKAPHACTCTPHPSGKHRTRCGLGDNPHELLCLDCAEKALGGEITLDDLSPCIANYATFVLVNRIFDAERRGDLFRLERDAPVPSMGCIDASIDPVEPRPVCSAVPPEDARILRDRELEELRCLMAACLAWERDQPPGSAVVGGRDRALLDAIGRARAR